MSEPSFCYKCDSIVTFCECDKSITTQEGALEYFKERIAALEDVLRSKICTRSCACCDDIKAVLGEGNE